MTNKIQFQDLKENETYNVSYTNDTGIELHNPHLLLHISERSGHAIFVDAKGHAKETNLANSHDMVFELSNEMATNRQKCERQKVIFAGRRITEYDKD